MYDAIVVGARCAGSPTAMLLARKGYRVLLVDRAVFPSDTMRLHFVRQPAVARLKRWGLLGRLVASGCPPITGYRVDFGDFPLVGAATPAGDVAEAYGPRRSVLDTILVGGAVEAGAELRERFSVDRLLIDEGRARGIAGRSAAGTPVTERARIVIGADGLHSLVARGVEAPVYEARPTVACYYYSYWSGVPVDALEVYRRDRRLVLAFPTNDRLTCVTIGWQRRAFESVRADLEGSFQDALDLVPELAERVRSGRREERFRGTADLPNVFRRPHGPGWALVGDAGHHKDPYLAQGINDAFRDAELLADAVDAGLSGRRPLDDALADYARQRDEAALPMYELNYRLALLEPPTPEQLRLRAALRGNQADTDRFLGVTAGTVPIQEFFAPPNIERILTAAAGRDAVVA